MLKILILTITLFLYSIPAYSSIGNEIDKAEYPKSDYVLPKTTIEKDNSVISGTISKNIEMNLKNCIKLALGNNPEISSAFHDILAADSRIKQVWSNYFPTFSWQTSYSHIKQLQLSDALGENLQFDYYLLGQISLQQLIYDFGVTQNQATIRRLEYEQNIKNFHSIVNDVIYKTKDAYYYVLYSYETEKVAKESVEKYQQFYDQAKAFYINGTNPKVDVTIAQTNLSNAKLNFIQAQNQVSTALATLNNVMGVPYIKNYAINDKLKFSPINISFESSIEKAIESRPELKLAQIKVESARQNLQLAKKSFYPTVTFDYQYMRGGRHWNSNDGFNIGGYLIFPSINLMYIRNQIKEDTYLYDKELANARNTQNTIYLEIQKSYLKLNEKRNQIPVAMLQVKQSKENYDLSFGRYRVGESTPTELKDSQTLYDDARLTYYRTLYEYNSARAELEHAIGINIPDSINLKK